MRDWLEGFHTGNDRKVRTLLLEACGDCGAVCVRDVSFDTLPLAKQPTAAPRRRNHVLGWYTGARPRQRIYT